MASGAFQKTVQDVLDRARSNLNDSQGSLWTDGLLLPKLSNAYEWLYSAMAKFAPDTVRKVTGLPYSADIVYTANLVDITSLLPADLYLPEMLEYRLSTAEDWSPLARFTTLPTQMNSPPATLTNWCWFDRTVKVNPSSSNALLRLTYLSLFADLTDVGTNLNADNVVAALAYRLAADAAGSRGQTPLMQSNDARAGEMLGMVLDVLVMNDQFVQRRGRRFGNDGATGLGYTYTAT